MQGTQGLTQGYHTVRHDAQSELIINKSRFIGYCFPADTEEHALGLLEDVRKSHRDASHNCYAYSIGIAGGAARFSDDGEPGGTAGLPIMEAIRKKGVTNLLCVVTRYFGGILLGAGGLTRAYAKAARAAIEAAEPVFMRPCTRFSIKVDYTRWGALEPVLHRYGKVENISYTDAVCAMLLIPNEREKAFYRAVADCTDGKIQPKAMDAVFWEFPIEEGDIGE